MIMRKAFGQSFSWSLDTNMSWGLSKYRPWPTWSNLWSEEWRISGAWTDDNMESSSWKGDI